MLVKELVVIVILLLPVPDKYVSWTINEVPTQVQLMFKDGREASYPAKNVSCETVPEGHQLLLVLDSQHIPECYLADVIEPTFVRHSKYWLKVRESKQYDNKQNPFQSKSIRGWERLP